MLLCEYRETPSFQRPVRCGRETRLLLFYRETRSLRFRLWGVDSKVLPTCAVTVDSLIFDTHLYRDSLASSSFGILLNHLVHLFDILLNHLFDILLL